MILQWGLISGKLAVRRYEPAQNVNSQLTSLKQTWAYYQHIFCLEKIIRTGLEIHASPVDHTLDEHGFGGSKFREPTRECNSLLDGGILLQTIPARSLDLTAHIEECPERDIDHVAILQSETLWYTPCQ
jgi:hypothetical protein